MYEFQSCTKLTNAHNCRVLQIELDTTVYQPNSVNLNIDDFGKINTTNIQIILIHWVLSHSNSPELVGK